MIEQIVTALPVEFLKFAGMRIAEFFLVAFIPVVFLLVFRMGVNSGKRQMLTELELRRIAAQIEEADNDEE